MKKKILSALAAVTVLSGALAISSPSAFAAELPNEGISVLAEDYKVNNLYRAIPDAIVAMGEFDYGGLHYTVDASGKFTLTSVANPELVRELIINDYGNKGLNTISTDIDWSKYTNLQNVIVTSNNMRIVKDILPALPSGINLYLGGSCNISGDYSNTTFKNLYYYATYDNHYNDFDNETVYYDSWW